MNSESIWSICKPVITAVLVKRDFTCSDFTAILVLFLEGGGLIQGGAYFIFSGLLGPGLIRERRLLESANSNKYNTI